MTRRECSLEAFSKVVESIYDCALNPEHWRETLRLVAELTDTPKIAIGVMDYAQERLVYNVEYGHDPAYWQVYLGEFAVNPLLIRSHQRLLGEVFTEKMLANRAEIYAHPLHNEWGRPQRLGDYLGINAVRSGSRVAGLGANRKEWQPSYSEHGFQLFRFLAPHFCRSFAISDIFDLQTITAQALEATLDALATGVYLTDRSGRVVYMNRAAEHQIKCSDVLRIANNRLAPVSRGARAAMSAAIATAIADEAAAPPGGMTLALPGGNKPGLVATILPLDRGQRHCVSGPFAAAAAVFVQDPMVVPPYPGEAFAKLYGLTRAELRVLLAMAPGLGVKEAAAILGVGEVTARTHLQHIFSKTGTVKQTELLNLLKNSTPPVQMA